METFYQTTLTYIHSHSNLKKIIIILARYAPIITFIIYPSLITVSYTHLDVYKRQIYHLLFNVSILTQ